MLWYLLFRVPDSKSEVKFRHIVKTLQEDLAVQLVEVLENEYLWNVTVSFREGFKSPSNKPLKELHKVYGYRPGDVHPSWTILDRILNYERP